MICTLLSVRDSVCVFVFPSSVCQLYVFKIDLNFPSNLNLFIFCLNSLHRFESKTPPYLTYPPLETPSNQNTEPKCKVKTIGIKSHSISRLSFEGRGLYSFFFFKDDVISAFYDLI